MSNHQLTEEQPTSRQTNGRVILITGIILLLFGLYISAFMIPDALNALSGPQVMTLSEAAEFANIERTYARIEDGTWDCDTLYYVEGLSPRHTGYGGVEEETKFTEVFFTDNEQDVVMLVTLSGDQNCNDFVEQDPAGYLYAMSDSTRRELTNDARLARYFDTDTFLEFCGYCGRDNSLIGAIFGVIFMVSGIALLIFNLTLKSKGNG